MISVLFIISIFAIVIFFLGYLLEVEEADDALILWLLIAVVSFILK